MEKLYRFLVFFLREQHVEIIQVHFHFLIKITMKNSRGGGNILDRKKSGTNFHRGTISRNLVEEVGRFNNQWLIYTMKIPFRDTWTHFEASSIYIYTSIRPSLHIRVFRMAKLYSVSSQLHGPFLPPPPPYFFFNNQ